MTPRATAQKESTNSEIIEYRVDDLLTKRSWLLSGVKDGFEREKKVSNYLRLSKSMKRNFCLQEGDLERRKRC